jgi:hypothetical protein
MKLQEFVSQTLREVIAAVKEAQKDAKAAGAVINPSARSVLSNPKQSFASVLVDDNWVQVPVQDMDFDVAVTSMDTTQQEAGAGIFVAAIGLGAKEKADTSNSSVSRIKFSVPIALPAQSMK